MKTSFLYGRASYSPPEESQSTNLSDVGQWSQGEMYKGRYSYGRKKFQYSSGEGFGRPKPKDLQIHRDRRGFTGYQIKTTGRNGDFTLY